VTGTWPGTWPRWPRASTTQQAFTFVVRASHDTGTRLRLIAAQLVDDVDRRGTPPDHPEPVNPEQAS